MSRHHLCLAVLAAFFLDAAGSAGTRVERGSLIYDNVPDAPAELTERLDAYLNARQATPLGWSPKGLLLIATRFGDVDQLHVVDRPGGDRRQISFLHEPIDYAAFSPDPNRNDYLYQKDANGDEKTQLYYQHAADPLPKLLTDGKSINGGALWSNTGRQIAFFSTARDGVSYDIDIVEPAAGTLPHLAVTGGDGAAWYPLDWSPDDRKLLVLKYVSSAEGYLYVVDLGSGQKREVDPAPAKVGIVGAKFSRDGQGVYMISDRDGDFAKLRYINLFTADRTVISAPIPWDIEDLAISRDGHYLAFTSNENGASKLNVTDLRIHQDLTPPKLPGPGLIDHLSFDSEGKRLAFGYTRIVEPRDAYVLDLAANRVDAWTRSETGPVDTGRFVTPRLAQFPTFDRQDGRPRQLPVYLYEPVQPGRHPAIILLHGGPESQFRPGFDPWVQFLVNELGFAVVAPNIRGSSGYGKSFVALDNGMLRDDAVKDLGALIVWVGLQGNIDARHLAIAGASYGGYLALAGLVNYGDRLMGGVDFAGIGDFISYLTNIAPYRRDRLRAEFGDERDPDVRAYLRRISPLTNADRISKPLLVVHGRNDSRVPDSESDQIVNRLRSRGAEVWFLQARDEGNEFRRKGNSDAYYQTIAQFLKTLH